MLTRLRDWFTKKQPKHLVRARFSFDGHVIRAKALLARERSVGVEDIREIGVETTDDGPFYEDVFWLINRGTDELRIPEPSPVFEQLMGYFGSLKGFDWRPFIEAMACCDCRYFLCWRREDAAR